MIKAYKKESVENNKIQMLGSLVAIGEDRDNVIWLLEEETANKNEKIAAISKEMLKEIREGQQYNKSPKRTY